MTKAQLVKVINSLECAEYLPDPPIEPLSKMRLRMAIGFACSADLSPHYELSHEQSVRTAVLGKNVM